MKSFFKAINVSIDDIEKFEEKEIINKIPFVKSSWYNWLINKIGIFKTNIFYKRVYNVHRDGNKPRKLEIENTLKVA